jgi:hypothetical protein
MPAEETSGGVLLHETHELRMTWVPDGQDPSGQSARGALAGLVAQWGNRLCSAKGTEQQALHSALSAQEGVPLLPLPRPLFTSASSHRPFPLACFQSPEEGHVRTQQSV